jgi:tight adherence protein B
MALAVRSGLSAIRAIHVAAEDADDPISEPLRTLVEVGGLGDPFQEALERFADTIGSDDARLFSLVVELHARTGGDLARALEEVAGTIRHRVRVRRELRALSAQGRISGTVLGVLPIGFFLVLALTSRRDITPVITTPAGAAMIVSGLVMEVLAFLWIRHLLAVEA